MTDAETALLKELMTETIARDAVMVAALRAIVRRLEEGGALKRSDFIAGLAKELAVVLGGSPPPNVRTAATEMVGMLCSPVAKPMLH